MTRFKAIQSGSEKIAETWNGGEIRTFEVDPEIIRVEDFKFADCMGNKIRNWGRRQVNPGDSLDLNSSVCSDGTWAISSKRI